MPKTVSKSLIADITKLIDLYLRGHLYISPTRNEVKKFKSHADFLCGACQTERKPNSKYKRGDHQFCISDKAFDDALKIIDKCKKGPDELLPSLEKAQDFDELIQAVYNLIGMVSGIGATVLYDYSIAYGFNKHHIDKKIEPRIPTWPEKFVYVHTVPLRGAKALRVLGLLDLSKLPERGFQRIEVDNIDVPRNKIGGMIPIDAFHSVFSRLDTLNLENFLCHYVKELEELTKKYK